MSNTKILKLRRNLFTEMINDRCAGLYVIFEKCYYVGMELIVFEMNEKETVVTGFWQKFVITGIEAKNQHPHSYNQLLLSLKKIEQIPGCFVHGAIRGIEMQQPIEKDRL